MGQHWYSPNGDSAYTVIAKNGKERDATLADARKLQLSPSVTTITGVEAAPALVNYKINQVLDAFDNAPGNILNIDNWRKIIIRESGEHAKKAAERGNQLHNALESYYLTGNQGEHWDFIEPVVKFLKDKFPEAEWIPEASFTHPLGFGGKVDMHSKVGDGIVLDFKTKDTDDVKKMKAYDGHHMQTAAYAMGLGIPKARRYNLFISTRQVGLLELTESVDMKREWGMFKDLLNFWQKKNRYTPDLS